ncbi:hypothetical protein [Streptomyces yerevanensis]|uniref:hypothetical protein n=1 Tax=Streptomyces yerevanensis TaxID=66378 RepID=UPI0012FF2135|nr:hypothetical protein [Streptomyces yerevanensis]
MPGARESPARRSATVTTAMFEHAVRAHLVSGEPLDQDEEWAVARKLAKGWDPRDPLLQVSLTALARESGACSRSGGPFKPAAGFRQDPRFTALRPLIEQAVQQVGLTPRWGRQAALITRADGQGDVPWTLPTTREGLARLLIHIRTGCIITIAALSGMRSSELVELPADCQLPLQPLGPGRVRHRLKSKVLKGRGPGGTWDEWVVIPEAYETAGIARALARPGAAHLDLCRHYRDLRAWINGPEGQRLGLPPLPDEVVHLRILRRTLALELAHRPGGLFAAKLQLKHLSVTTTEGYARPGGAQAKLLAEVGKEEETRNLSLTFKRSATSRTASIPPGPEFATCSLSSTPSRPSSTIWLPRRQPSGTATRK